MVLELIKQNGEGTLFKAHESLISEEEARKRHLYMMDEIKETESGHMRSYYRLYATEPHTIEQAFVYDIICPKCSGRLKQIGRQLSMHELGLYTCPECNRRKEGK